MKHEYNLFEVLKEKIKSGEVSQTQLAGILAALELKPKGVMRVKRINNKDLGKLGAVLLVD